MHLELPKAPKEVQLHSLKFTFSWITVNSLVL